LLQQHKVKRNAAILCSLVIIVILTLLLFSWRDYDKRIYYEDSSGHHVLDGFTYDEATLKSHIPQWLKDFQLPQELAFGTEKELDGFQIFNRRIDGICFLHITLYYFETVGERCRADILIWQDEALTQFYTAGNVLEFNKAVKIPVNWTASAGRAVSYFEYPPEYQQKWGYGAVSGSRFTAYIFSPDVQVTYSPQEREQFYTLMAETALQFMAFSPIDM